MTNSAFHQVNAGSAVSARGLRHHRGGRLILALDRWQVASGSHCLVLGPSGSGKTTLLHLVAGLLAPTEGGIEILNRPWSTLPAGRRDRERGRAIGLVFQTLHLIDAVNVFDNLALARRLAGLRPDPDRIAGVLDRIGLTSRAGARPAELSQGEAQRVAIARAVVNRPPLLLADEPTSALDDANCGQVLALLKAEAAACNATLMVATHDRRLMDHFEHRLDLTRAETQWP